MVETLVMNHQSFCEKLLSQERDHGRNFGDDLVKVAPTANQSNSQFPIPNSQFPIPNLNN
ncbi:hypothetical protein MiSe_89740 [Microseira wollei NIES-4236]|uniref:Uncharacterized protein n=1 Tax=Microseira wollei NIES-4236 TaxID=2530354 RepID=A0AAV3XP73_9CYAN|nr:hypothetical protein MiSe_89740 [Microseira wollei NIES-4236]